MVVGYSKMSGGMPGVLPACTASLSVHQRMLAHCACLSAACLNPQLVLL
jgi:hypothetical protein